jgi:PAS domain S-box-containing protein
MGVWDYDKDFKNRFFSKEWYEIRGLDEVIPNETPDHVEWLNSLHPDDRAQCKKLVTQFHNGDIKSVSVEYRLRHSNGSWIWILARGEAVSWDEIGSPTRFVGTDIDITSIKEAQDANRVLRDDQMRNHVALECAKQGVWDTDNDHEASYLSDTWRTMRGHPAQSTYGASERDWIDDIHPDDLNWVINQPFYLSDKAATNEINYQYRQRTEDGQWMWVLSRGKVVERDPSGTPIRRIGTDTDITEIKEAEMFTARLSSTLGLAVEASQAGVWETDAQTGDALWDAKTREIYGLDEGDQLVSEETFQSFIHPDDVDLVEKECNVPARLNQDFSSAYRIIHPTKGVRHVRTDAQFQSGGDHLRHVGIVWDVTEAQEQERQLRQTHAVLDQVVQQMAQGLLVFTGDTVESAKVIFKNQKIVDMLGIPGGITEHETTFTAYLEYILNFVEWPVEGAANKLELLELIRSDKKMQVIARLPNGRIVRTNGSKFGDNGRIVTFTDVTDIFQSEQERTSLAESLSHMERLQSVGKLTGGIAHDFNNLLAAIIGNTELLAHELGDGHELLSQVLQAAEQGAELTQRLLAFSRKQPLVPKPIDLIELMESTKKLLRPVIGETIGVNCSAGADLWNCIADAGQLQNALINLAVNARDAMPKGGEIRVHAINAVIDKDDLDLAKGDYVKITVSDTGFGMGEKVALRAFEPFYSTKGIGEGSGLGLSMVYGFVKQSHGDIVIDSKPGEGTSIHVYLPKSKEVVLPKPVQHVPIAQKAQKSTIMLVEDNPSVRRVLQTALKKLGYDIVTYEDAADALKGFANTEIKIDLVLSDVGLPGGMNGIELCARLKTMDPHLRVLNISGYHDVLQSEANRSKSKFEILLKPFSIADLAARLSRLLDTPVDRVDALDDIDT